MGRMGGAAARARATDLSGGPAHRSRVPCLVMATLAASGLAQAPEPADVPPPPDPAAEQRLLERAGPGMSLRGTDHFLIAYNASPESLSALISRLEATHRAVYRFCEINDLPARPLTQRLEVIFYETYEQYGQAADKIGFAYQGSSGFFSRSTNVATFYNMLNSPDLAGINQKIADAERRLDRLGKSASGDREASRKAAAERGRLVNIRDRAVEHINRTTVQHETAHQLFFNAGIHVRGARNPQWLVEGLACLFETPPSASGAGAATTNQMRLADFRECVGHGNAKARLKLEDVRAAIADGKLVALPTLISDADLFLERTNPRLVQHYSQAWSLVFYLQRAKREQFAEYLRVLNQRGVGAAVTPEQELADFQAVFGPVDERFERAWASFVLDLRFKPSELP